MKLEDNDRDAGRSASRTPLHMSTPILPYIRVADYAVRKPWRSPERRLLDYLLVYVHEGRLVIHVDGHRHDLEPGDFGLVPPLALHTLEGMTDTVTPFAHLDIFYSPSRDATFVTRPGHIDLSEHLQLAQPLLREVLGVDLPVKIQLSQPTVLRDAMLKMIGIWQQRTFLAELEAQHLATGIVLSLLQEFHADDAPRSRHSQSLEWITDYLSAHIAESITVADMAARARLSQPRFASVFRQRFGMPPHRYLLHLRVQHAQDLLTRTDLALKEIASCCGFADVHHFSKAFRRLCGASPGAFRRRARTGSSGSAR